MRQRRLAGDFSAGFTKLYQIISRPLETHGHTISRCNECKHCSAARHTTSLNKQSVRLPSPLSIKRCFASSFTKAQESLSYMPLRFACFHGHSAILSKQTASRQSEASLHSLSRKQIGHRTLRAPVFLFVLHRCAPAANRVGIAYKYAVRHATLSLLFTHPISGVGELVARLVGHTRSSKIELGGRRKETPS